MLAVAGTDTDAVVAHVRAGRSEEWIVVGDVVGAWATATGARPGVGAIAGTGSNVFGVGADGRAWRAGGWGHQLGDEGSGYWLGLQSIKAALRDRERSGPETALSDAAVEFFGAASVEALAAMVYSKPLTKGEIAAFAIETARLAEQGDAVARELYERGARELAQQIAAVIHQTGLQGEFPVGLIGSAYKAGAGVRRPAHAGDPRARAAGAGGGRGDGAGRRLAAARRPRLRRDGGAGADRPRGAHRRGAYATECSHNFKAMAAISGSDAGSPGRLRQTRVAAS